MIDLASQNTQINSIQQRLGSIEQSDAFQNFKKLKDQVSKDKNQQLVINNNVFKKQEEQRNLLNQINEKVPQFISQLEFENYLKGYKQEVEALCKQSCLAQFQQYKNDAILEEKKQKSDQLNLQQQIEKQLLQFQEYMNVISNEKGVQNQSNLRLQVQINVLKSQMIQIIDNKQTYSKQNEKLISKHYSPKLSLESKNAQMKKFQGKIEQIQSFQVYFTVLTNLQQINIPNQIDKSNQEQVEEQNFMNPQSQNSQQEDLSSDLQDLMMQSAMEQLEQLIILQAQSNNQDQSRLQIVQGQINELYSLSNITSNNFQFFIKDKENLHQLYQKYDVQQLNLLKNHILFY